MLQILNKIKVKNLNSYKSYKSIFSYINNAS